MIGTKDLITGTLTAQGYAKDLPDLARRIGKSVSTTRSSLARLILAKKVTARSDGGYELFGTNPVPPPPPPPWATQAPPAPPPTTVIRTHWIVLGDRSGSMRSLERPTMEEMNRTFDSIQLTTQQPNQVAVVSCWAFGSSIVPLFNSLPAERLHRLTGYNADMGGTALFDAMGDAIVRAENEERNHPETSFVLMVLTDGEENTSSRWARNTGYIDRVQDRDVSKILELIRRVQGTDKWTIALQVPRGGYKEKLCRDFGIPEGNVMEWDQTDRGAREAGAARAAGIANYAVARAAGKTSVKSMFVTTDLSNVSSADVQSSLDNVASKVKVLTVKKEEDICTFITRETSQPFMPGTAFYQLTKTESRVQPDKIILVMEKGKKEVWGGAAARRLLGLPDNQHCRVKPGNHSKFDIFIQSKSTNRKLVRGTNVIYAPMGI